jgi:hypothetical protein
LKLIPREGLVLLAGCALALPAMAAPGGVPSFEASDRAVFGRIVELAARHPAIPDRLTTIGLSLVDTPYQAGTLDGPGPEVLVCQLRGLDCFTFVETALALARITGPGKAPDPAVLWAEVQASRYRDGQIAGYSSRLHYLSEWLQHNIRRGVIRDLTPELGGQPMLRSIHYMTAHRARYPALVGDHQFQAVAATEQALSRQAIQAIPKARVPWNRLTEGDIVAFIPNTDGLDYSHVGLVHLGSDGQPHLLHAPDVGQKVRVNPEPLEEYVRQHRKVVAVSCFRLVI